MNVHTFSHEKFLKNDPIPVEPYNIDEKNQALKLSSVTAVVNSVPYLDPELGCALFSSLL